MHLRSLIFVAIVSAAACSAADDQFAQPESVARPAREYVERLVPRFDGIARQRVESLVVAEALKSRLEQEAQRSWSDRLVGGIKYADLLRDTYASVDWTLSFASPSGATPRAVGIMERLARAPEEALPNDAYHLETLEKLRKELDAHKPDAPPSFSLSADEAERAVAWLEADKGALDDPATLRRLVDAVLGRDVDPLAPRLAKVADRYREQTAASTTWIVELEVRTADAALRFARDLKHFNYKRVSWPDLEAAGGGKAVIYRRLDATLRALFATETTEGADEVLLALRPKFDQYNRLVDALARFRAMQDWPAVGHDTSDSAALRSRLEAEGYTGEDALATYQTTHQFDVGPPTAGLWRSLNVPRAKRVAQIELTLQRYRETFYRDELDYVFVNIPDFHAEVYRNGERRLRFRVVVGNTERTCDPQTQRWHYPNATPTQWAPLEHLMLNPWWNVPTRLFNEEIVPHLGDQQYLDAKGYEIYERGGEQHARQRPSAGNALGLVKFIFPNEHNTYMHDTPSKQYFARPVRAYSHGCVRVEDPLDLAAYFMTEYDLGGRERLDKIMGLGSTIRIDVPGTIPVFFEYYTVRVDDGGKVWFLADPYLLDEARMNPEALSCGAATPDPAATEAVADVPVPDVNDHGP